MAEDQRKNELIAELARTRGQLSVNAASLKRDLDFPARFRRAFKGGPLPWLVGAAVLGLAIASLPRRTKKVPVVVRKKQEPLEQAGKAGLLLGAMKIAFDFARPVLLRWITQRAETYFHPAPTQPARRR